jgi:hypothetical protein
MEPGKPCVHCTQQGCAIYASRPVEPCVSFKCAWLVDASPLPDNMRPNECGAIVMLDKKWKGKPIIMASPTGEKIPQATLDWLMAYARQHSIPLLLRENLMKNGVFNGFKKMGYGPSWFIHAVETEILPDDVAML